MYDRHKGGLVFLINIACEQPVLGVAEGGIKNNYSVPCSLFLALCYQLLYYEPFAPFSKTKR